MGASRRLETATKLRMRRDRATPIGKAIIDRILQLNLLVEEAARQLNLTRNALWALMSKPRRWARPYTRDALASFLRRPISDIETLLREGGGRSRARLVEVECSYCGATFPKNRAKVRSSRSRSRRHYCSRKHHQLWKEGRRTSPPLPPSGKRSGRHLQSVEILEDAMSDAAIAQETSINAATVQLVRTGHHEPGPINRYQLELLGVLAPCDRPRLTEAILEFCITAKIRHLAELARRADFTPGTLTYLMQRGGATRPTLSKLARVMGRRVGDLERLSVPTLRGRTIADKRALGRPPTFTSAQALEVHRLIHEERESIVGAGRRMGWPVTPAGHSKRAENAFRYAKSLCRNCSPSN